MSGFGERFKRAGYRVPKPLIVVNGKPIIQHVVEMFPSETNFIFICNKEHLADTSFNMIKILKSICPNGKIFPITPHKLGPVYAVIKAFSIIDLDIPTIVNYCDFTVFWDYMHFKETIEKTQCDGAIPCYRGFHPHTLWSNYYAYVRENNLRAIDIQEKQSFTDIPTNEFASTGSYYFKSGKLMLQYFQRCLDSNLTVGNEYYASMAYKPMLEDNLEIIVYEVQHFMQWGVPADLEEYQYWSKIFKHTLKKQKLPNHKGVCMLPMVGAGSRFASENYKLPKPLIKVSGQAMASQALADLPITERQRFVVRKDLSNLTELKKELNAAASKPEFITLEHLTDGQATTCIEASQELNTKNPITIAACDNGMIYDVNKIQKLIDDSSIDVIVWGARGYPGAIRNPEMYGWIEATTDNKIQKISVKKKLNNINIDPIVVGTFTFKRLSDFSKSVALMKSRKGLINDEYYIDNAINDAITLGLNCYLFEIDCYVCWGTPNDLRTFEYWQSCFHKWNSHPYRLELDSKIPNNQLDSLKSKYKCKLPNIQTIHD